MNLEELEGRPPHKDRPSISRFSSHHAADTRNNPTPAPAKTMGAQLVWVPCTWTSRQDLSAQLERRRQAAKRSVPLDCGCRDGWTCRCTEPPLTDDALDDWRDAAWHVLGTGNMPMVPLQIRRALWRRPADRELAELLHRGCGGAVG